MLDNSFIKTECFILSKALEKSNGSWKQNFSDALSFSKILDKLKKNSTITDLRGTKPN